MFANFALLLLLTITNQVLLVREKSTPFGDYSLPGTEIKRGETARAAIAREIYDIDYVVVEPQALEFAHVCNSPESFTLVFKATDWFHLELYRYGGQKYDLRWFPLDDLPENMVPAHRHALEQIQKNIPYSEHG